MLDAVGAAVQVHVSEPPPVSAIARTVGRTPIAIPASRFLAYSTPISLLSLAHTYNSQTGHTSSQATGEAEDRGELY